MRRALAALALAGLALMGPAVAQDPQPVNDVAILAERPAATLEAYRLFRDPGAREPNAGVLLYELNTQLYSDGALKFRYVYVPAGARARANPDGVYEFPVGAVLVKTFAFAPDMRRPAENVRFLETRLLIRRESGWVALPYVWNEAQTEARLSLAGAEALVSFTDEEGRAIALDWAVPNTNQCAGCHMRAGVLTPIGPSTRNLNRDIAYVGASRPQLTLWAERGVLDAAPAGTSPRMPNAYDAADGDLETRARAYLDVNCAHCHNPQGPAHTSGLDLSWGQTQPIQWGVFKRPIAAGRGSAGLAFSIEPGLPERSILLHRMESMDPGVMMPELGRTLVDDRGVALMREWIAGMGEDGRPRR